MNPRKIAIIRNAAPQDFGGGERFPVFLAKVLAEYGYKPLVISRSASLLEFSFAQNIPALRGWWLKKQNWSGNNQLLFPIYIVWQILLSFFYLWVLITRDIDVVHIQSKDDFVAASIAGHVLGKQIIWTDHADLKHILLNTDKPLRNPSGKLVRWVMRYAESVTVVSESERKLVGEHIGSDAFLSDKLTVVHNGAFDHFQPKQVKQSGDKIQVLFAGRLVTDKGIGEAIEAMRLLQDTHPNITLDIIGTGPQADHFQSLASDVKSINFHGHQSDPTSWMKRADIFIQPTYHEGFSLVLVEASMMQLPIIATEVGGNPEIIVDNVTGLLIPPKNPAALAAAISRLADDSGLRAQLGDKARTQYVEKFQFDKIVEKQFIPLYEKNNN